MIRSRAQSVDEGEIPTNKFCALENNFFLDKTIKKVCNGKNEIITEQKQILSSVEDYYRKLFKNRDVELKNVNMEDLFKNLNTPKLTENQKSSIEGVLTIS